MSRRRTLGIPDASTREYKLPAVLYWLYRRRALLLEDQGDIYACPYQWKRRLKSLDRQISETEAALREVATGQPFAWLPLPHEPAIERKAA